MGQEGEKHYANEEIHDFIVQILPRVGYHQLPAGTESARDWLRGKKETYPPPCSWKAFCLAVAFIGDTRNWVGKDSIMLPGGAPYRVKKLLERTMALDEVISTQTPDLDVKSLFEAIKEKHPIICDLNLETMIVSVS